MADAGARAPDGSRVAGTRWPFVGRAATLAEVGAALAGDRISAVLLCGPAGAGKTRLAEECAARAAVAGRPVIPVTAGPALAQIPLGALVALLTSRDVGVDAFSGDFVRLFAHARRVVAALGPRRPVMLVDDLPALDPLSAAVVAQLVQAGAVVLLATVRDGEAGQVAVAAALLHDAVRLGHADLAAAELTRLARRCDSPLVAARAAHATAAARNAVTGLSDAADTFEGMGAVLLAAEAAAAAGRAARAAGSGRAATALVHRARTLAVRCEGARTPGLFLADSVEPLTAREREVATLAAAGLSSRTIAERLVLSVRTVDNHLQASYAKLGISGRAELNGALRVPA